MTLLSLLLLGNAVLHGVIVGRFGIKGNALRVAPLISRVNGRPEPHTSKGITVS